MKISITQADIKVLQDAQDVLKRLLDEAIPQRLQTGAAHPTEIYWDRLNQTNWMILSTTNFLSVAKSMKSFEFTETL